MKNFTIYLAGGMSKFNKENFDEGNEWRVYVNGNLKTVTACTMYM